MSHSKPVKYDELTCLTMQSDTIKYVGLVDGGSNVSIIAQEMVDRLKLNSVVVKDRQTVKSFNGACSTITGRVDVHFRIGSLKFKHTFLIQSALSTGTQALLGLDFLKKSEAHIKYGSDGVSLTLLDIKNIPLVESQKKCFGGNTLRVLTIQSAEPKHLFVKAAENKKNNPMVSKVVRAIMPGSNWPKQITLKQQTLNKSILLEEQLVTT